VLRSGSGGAVHRHGTTFRRMAHGSGAVYDPHRRPDGPPRPDGSPAPPTRGRPLRLRSPAPTPALRYGAALAALTLAVGLTVALAPFLSQAAFVLLWPAVIFAAWYGGFRAALLVVVGGVVAVDLLMLRPGGSALPTGAELIQVFVFALAAVAISRLAARASAATDELDEANRQFESNNRILQDQAIELEQSMEATQALNEELESTLAELQRTHASLAVANDRLAFHAHPSQALAASLDRDETLRSVAGLAIESVADWCVVETLDPEGERSGHAIAHRDPERVRWAEEIDRRYPPDPDAPRGARHVARTGELELYRTIDDELLVAGARDDEHLALLREAGFTAAMVVPLVARGRVFGTITLVSTDQARTYDDDDLLLAEDLGRRAAAAIENADLYRIARRGGDRARLLQRFATELNRAAGLDEVADACLTAGMQELGANAGSLAVLVSDEEFEIVASRGYTSDVAHRCRRFPVAPGRPLPDAVLQRTPCILSTRAEIAERYPRMASPHADADTAALIALPLTADGATLGGLSLSFGSERGFGELERAFILTIGEQAAQAIDRARLLESEREARAAAEEANRARTEFLSAMSHELRTPLNAIGGYVELLEMEVRGPITDAQRSDLERIRRAQAHLLRLISDILSFARIEAGRMEYTIVAVPIAPLIDEMEALIEPQLRSRGLSFVCEPCDPSVVARADRERTRQILLNLLVNAVKFTERGGVTVTAGADGDAVRIAVADTGRGIPPERLESIFDPFVQVDRGLTPEGQQGVGLGLAISRTMAHEMGGSIVARSVEGGGSVFELTLPRADSDA
jgi:signal transduction histidine kinase